MPIDIRPDHLQIVLDIIKKHIPNHEIWVFGSRSNGGAKKHSDLDLLVKGVAPLALGERANLLNDFSESNLPYKVDVVDWYAASEGFKQAIAGDLLLVDKN